MKKGILFFIVAVICLIGYVFLADPYITVYKIKKGIVAQDSEKLSENIDFPLLRQNLKEQCNAIMMKGVVKELKENPFGALGIALASKLIDGLVDFFVTPSSLAILMEGKKLDIESDTKLIKPIGGNETKPFKNARYSYDSINKFSIWVPTDEGEEIRFVLSRTGLSWKLSNIMVPFNKFEGQKGTKKLVKEPQPIEKPRKDAIVEKVIKKERDKESLNRLQEALEEIRRRAALDEIQKRGTNDEKLEPKLMEYNTIIWAKIKESWTIPENLLKEKEMDGLEAIVIIVIEKDGKIQRSWFEKRSGNSLYDQTAMRAIKKAEPFPPIPKEFGKDSLEIGIRFSPD